MSGDVNYSKVIEAEARELAEVPGGAELLILIGFIYLQEAKQHMDTFLGYETRKRKAKGKTKKKRGKRGVRPEN